MSRITSISRSAVRLNTDNTKPRSKEQASGKALVLVKSPSRRAKHARQAPQLAAFSAHVMAGKPRRGLKGDRGEQARVLITYKRLQNGVDRTGARLKLLA